MSTATHCIPFDQTCTVCNPSRGELRVLRGDVVCFRGIVSNYGHVQHMPVAVVSVGAKRVRVETLDLKRNRRINVNPQNLHLLGSTEYCDTADTSPFLAVVERIKGEFADRRPAPTGRGDRE